MLDSIRALQASCQKKWQVRGADDFFFSHWLRAHLGLEIEKRKSLVGTVASERALVDTQVSSLVILLFPFLSTRATSTATLPCLVSAEMVARVRIGLTL